MSEFYADVRVFRKVNCEVIRIVIGVIFRDAARNGCALGKNVRGIEAVVEFSFTACIFRKVHGEIIFI